MKPLVAVQSDSEHQRMLGAATRSMEKGETLRIQDARLLKLLAILIQDYERLNYTLPHVEPKAMLKDLLEERGLNPAPYGPWWDRKPECPRFFRASGR